MRTSPLLLTDPLMNAFFIVFTPKKGVLKKTEDRSKAQGVYFNCPHHHCQGEKSHAYTLLFDLETVPKDAAPPGRYTPIGNGLEDLTLVEIIRSKCGWRGCIRAGEIVSTLLQ